MRWAWENKAFGCIAVQTIEMDRKTRTVLYRKRDGNEYSVYLVQNRPFPSISASGV